MLSTALFAALCALCGATTPHYPAAELQWHAEPGCASKSPADVSSTTLLSSFCQYAPPPSNYYAVSCTSAEAGVVYFRCNADCSECADVSAFSSGECLASPCVLLPPASLSHKTRVLTSPFPPCVPPCSKAPGSASFRALCAPPTNPVLNVGRCQLIFFADAGCLRGAAPLFHTTLDLQAGVCNNPVEGISYTLSPVPALGVNAFGATGANFTTWAGSSTCRGGSARSLILSPATCAPNPAFTGARSLAAGQAAQAAGFPHAFNVADGFEGPVDAEGHRGSVAGWKADGLPWRQR